MKASLRVLVVEDDPTLAAVVQEALQEEGHATTCVPTAADAAPLVEQQSWDVLLMDAFGDSYAEPDDALRSTVAQLSDTLPVVLSTGRAWAQTSSPADLGVASILAKPYDLDALVSVLEHAARTPCAAGR